MPLLDPFLSLNLICSSTSLRLRIESIADDPQGNERIERTIQFCRANPGPTIVYVTQQKNTEKVAQALGEAGLAARSYHAGMEAASRKATQEWFMESSTAIVCATIAFGMGIDKGYSQEVGRAGRDGKISQCVLFLFPGDRRILENFARGNTPSRASVRAFVTRLCIDAKVQEVKAGGVLIVNMHQYAKDYDIRDVTLGLLFAQLELRTNWLRSVTPVYMVFDYKAPNPTVYTAHCRSDTSPAAKAITANAKFGKTRYGIDVQVASQISGVERNLIVGKLNDWHDSGWIELKATQRRNRYLLVQDLPDDESEINSIADQMFERMEGREKDEVARLESVFEWASKATCLPKVLAEYFGDIDSFPFESTCAYCTPCQSGGKPAIQYSYSPPPFDEIAFQKVLASTAIRDDARFLARIAFGITSPRITAEKLSKHPAFGSMSLHPWDELLLRCEMEVEAYELAYPDGPPVTAEAAPTKRARKRKGGTSSGGSLSQGSTSAKRARGSWKT